MILLIFNGFCIFSFSDISHRPLSHTYRQITFSKINQSKIIIIICENMKNIGKIIGNQGRPTDENITNIAFGYGKHL